MWQSSETITEVSKALVKALGTMTDVQKNREATVPTKSGSSYKYKYADLADTIQSVRPILAAHELAVMQTVNTNNPEYVNISTTILHSSGEWLTFEPLALPAGRTAQETGSAISYGRRYHLLACLGLAAEDDDGASAGARRAPAQRTQQTTTKQSTPKQPRTVEEKAIHEILAALDAQTRQALKQQFVEKYGLLQDLAVEQHPDALAWVEDKVRTDD